MAVRSPSNHISSGLVSAARPQADLTSGPRIDGRRCRNETVISGMGELHLEVYCERMRREFKAGPGCPSMLKRRGSHTMKIP